MVFLLKISLSKRDVHLEEVIIKEARDSFFDLGLHLLKSKFRIEDKLRFP